MANESVTDAAAQQPIHRCKHDVEMVNEVTERMLKMKAVADLLLCSRAGDLAEDTLNNIGWLLIDMADEAWAIVCERKTEEVPA